MDEIYQTGCFARYNFQKTLSNPRVYVAAAGVLFLLRWNFAELPGYLAREGLTMHAAELYILGMNSLYIGRYLYMGLLLLICDVPFLSGGVPYYLLRSRKSCWFKGQVLYLFGMMVGYNLFLVACFLLLTGGHITACGSWSQVVESALIRDFPDALSECMGVAEGLSVWKRFLTPWSVAGITFVWGCLWMFTLSVLFMVAVLVGGIRVGGFLMGIFFALDIMYRQGYGGFWWHKFSPMTLSRWISLRAPGVVSSWDLLPGALPTLPYGVAFYLLLLAAALVVGRVVLRRYDFLR